MPYGLAANPFSLFCVVCASASNRFLQLQERLKMPFSKQNKLTIDKTSHDQNWHQVHSFPGIIRFIESSSDGIRMDAWNLTQVPLLCLANKQDKAEAMSVQEKGLENICNVVGNLNRLRPRLCPFSSLLVKELWHSLVFIISFPHTNFLQRSILGQGFQKSTESTIFFQQELSRFFEFEQLFNDRREEKSCWCIETTGDAVLLQGPSTCIPAVPCRARDLKLRSGGLPVRVLHTFPNGRWMSGGCWLKQPSSRGSSREAVGRCFASDSLTSLSAFWSSYFPYPYPMQQS